MEHKFTTIFSSEPYYGKYDRSYRILGAIFAACALLILILGYILGSAFSLQARVILYGVVMLALLVLFTARMITDRVADWSTVLIIALIMALALMDVNDAGGWSAVFP